MKTRLSSLPMIFFILVMGLVLADGLVFAKHTQVYDLGGRTLRFAMPQFLAQVTPLGAPGEFNFYDPDGRLEAHIAKVEEMFNCKIEFVHEAWNDVHIDLLKTGVLAGDPPFDFWNTAYEVVAPVALEGFVYPLDDIIGPNFYDDYPPSFRYPPGLDRGFRVAGKLYGFESTNRMRECVVLFWNLSLFEREGLPNLYEVYEANEWTWDVMRDIARQATKDTDGDGVIDRYGLSIPWFPREASRFLPLTNNASFTEMIDGRVVFTIDSPNFIEALEFGQALFQEGIAANDPPNAAMRIAQAHGSRGIQDQDDDDYGMVPLPRGPRADKHVSPLWAVWYGALPITVEDPGAVIEVVKALWGLTEPYMDVDLISWEERYWQRQAVQGKLPDRHSLETWKWAAANSVAAMDGITRHVLMGISEVGWYEAMDAICFEGKSPAVAMAEIKPKAQALLDEYLRQ